MIRFSGDSDLRQQIGPCKLKNVIKIRYEQIEAYDS